MHYWCIQKSKLGFHCVIRIFYFFLKLNSHNFELLLKWSGSEVLIVFWSRNRRKSMKTITSHLGCVLSEVSWQHTMGHCKVSYTRVQGNRCLSAMYVIKLSEPQRRTTCLYISIQYTHWQILLNLATFTTKYLHFDTGKIKKALNLFYLFRRR